MNHDLRLKTTVASLVKEVIFIICNGHLLLCYVFETSVGKGIKAQKLSQNNVTL